MKNLSTGTGLALLAGAIIAWPVLDRLMPNANAVGIGTTAVTAVAAAATAQGAPTIVWYQSFARNVSISVSGNGVQAERKSDGFWVLRAWSDGKIEGRFVLATGSTTLSECGTTNPSAPCIGPWVVINNPASGLTFDADLNFDEAVDGNDLGMLLAKWGPAPRNPVPPSDCPLGLIN